MSEDTGSGIQIRFKPSKRQYEAWKYLNDNETSFVGYGGAAFSGKSYLLCYWVTSLAIAYPDTGWGIGRRELTTLKKTTLLTLFKVFGECGITDNYYTYNGQLNIITLFNKSQIFLIDTDYKPSDPLYTRFGGYELTGAAVDESAETQERAIEVLFTRIGRRRNKEYGIKAKMLETFNPSKDHIYKRYYHPYKTGDLPVSYKFVKALPSDNPSPEVHDYVDMILKNASSVTIERLIYGNFEYDDNPMAMMEYGKIVELYTNEFIPTGEKYMTCDIAYEGSDMFVIMLWAGLRVEKIIARDKISEVQVPNWINEHRLKWGVPLGNVIYDADGVKRYVKYSAKEGHLNGAKEFHNNGSPTDKAYFNQKSECYYKLAEYVNTNKIFISDQSYQKQVIEELEQIRKMEHADDNKLRVEKKESLKERLGRSPDFADALMMRMLIEINKPAQRRAGGSNWRP